jgi:outer membrane protein TolC
MKTLYLLAALVGLALIGLTGCGDKKANVNTAKLESSFSSSEATLKAEVQKAVDLIKAQDLANAVVQLQKTYARAKLTQEQKDAIKEMIETLQNQIAAGANKSVEKAAGQTTKALEDLQKAGKK